MSSTQQDRFMTLLTKGEIHFAPIGDSYYSATFYPHDKSDSIQVESQRGAEHLLMLLDSFLTELVLNQKEIAQDILKKADKLYPYPLAPGDATEMDSVLQKSFTRIFIEENIIKGYVIAPGAPIEDARVAKKVHLAGLYIVQGTGESIQGLLMELYKGTPEMIEQDIVKLILPSKV